MEENQWIYIDNCTINSNYNAISCDTRDFYLFRNTIKDKPTINFKVKKEYLINIENIIPWLKSVEAASGGKCEWRYLNAKVKNCNNWNIKYIRFLKFDENQYIVCNSNFEPINYNKIINNIIKEHLYAQ